MDTLTQTETTSPTRRGLFPVLCAAVTLDAAAIGMLFPLLARIQDAHHIPTWGLGIMSGANFFGALLTQTVVARHLDGHRARRLLLAGLALGVLAQLWFGCSSALWSFAAARALGGCSYGIVMPAALRAGSVGVPLARRGERLGRLSSAQMLGIVCGPLLGTSLAAVGGLRAPFLCVAAATAVVLVALWAVSAPIAPSASEVVPTSETVGAGTPVAHRPKVTSRPVVALLLLAAAAQLPTGLYDALWSRLLTDRGADPLMIGLSLTLFGIPFVVLAPLGGRLAGRGTPMRWAVGGLAVAACFLASYGFVRSAVVIVVLGTIEACAQAVAVPAGLAAVGVVFPDRWAATGQGWFSGAGTGAAGVASVLGAPVYGALGPGAVFGGGAVISVALSGASLAVGRRTTRA